ncbi:MAG: hypothetical protein JXA30_11040 [Deltaproteobacteria bacterium]|nr:hypothetical protein [Deltaproteobacteria bacterium]
MRSSRMAVESYLETRTRIRPDRIAVMENGGGKQALMIKQSEQSGSRTTDCGH